MPVTRSTSEEMKIAQISETLGIGEKDAVREIERVENERRTFIRRHYGEDVTKASNYDLVINSGTTGISGAAALIREAYRARFGAVPNLDVSTAPAALGPVID